MEYVSGIATQWRPKSFVKTIVTNESGVSPRRTNGSHEKDEIKTRSGNGQVRPRGLRELADTTAALRRKSRAAHVAGFQLRQGAE